MKYFLINLLSLIALSTFAQNRNIDSTLQQFMTDKAIENASVSIYVSNVDSGTPLLFTEPQACITPASVLKLITSATAFEKLGSNYRFHTNVWGNGEIKQGTLNGDLVITGGGDPSLGSSYFNLKSKRNDFLKEWVHLLKGKGIDSISGNIIVDASIYSDQDVPQTWIWEDLGNYFGAAAQGIAIYDNTCEIVFKTADQQGGETSITSTNPFIPNLALQNEVRASNDLRDRAYVYGSPFDSFRIVKGTLPKGRSHYKIKASIPDPAILLAYELKQMLIDSLVYVGGNAEKATRSLHKQSTDSLFISWDSPKLSKIIEQMNHESINLFAEHLCKHIGYITLKEGSTNAGTEAIKSFWTQKGINTNNLFLSDGSGLSRVNAITAKTLVDVLSYMHNKSEYFKDYYNSIPRTGLEGTQLYYFHDSFLKGKARAKSGSMTRVRSFAGYMTTKEGTNIAYAIIVNNFNCSSTTMAHKMGKLMEQMYLEL
jgi:D-alanyl-D-alanine carboxypeptidase/D-alanyl-D-alanine-endopeptidase (penicillin-binding protein 4)